MQTPAAIWKLSITTMLVLTVFLATATSAENSVRGQVLGGGKPIANSTVTLWEASDGAPKQLAQARTNADGRFELRGKAAASDTAILYLIASGGTAKAKEGSADNASIVLLSVLGNKAPSTVVINELTTVASAYTAARFISS